MTTAEVPTGLVLAAGAGRRFGGPKALARMPDGTAWTERAVRTLREAGCERVVVVLGAGAEQARPLLPPDAEAVVAEHWAEGVGASLAAGLAAVADADLVLVTLVDLPGLPLSAVRRVLGEHPARDSLRRAVYGGRPGHPVLVGAAHLAGLAAGLAGDRGGRDHLAAAGVTPVECGDLFSGADQDERPGGTSSPSSR
jgi:CTP:molybdopterin cytidylyltransferase MocA